MSYPNWSKIAVGGLFRTNDGAVYKKTSDLTFDDHVGIEQNIDPLFDRKITGAISTAPAPQPEVVPGATTEGEALTAPESAPLKFADIPVGGVFELDGEKYRKLTDLTFADGIGIEQYWSPLVDQKLAKTTSAPVIDTSAKVVKSE